MCGRVNFRVCFIKTLWHVTAFICLSIDYVQSINKGSPYSLFPTSEPPLISPHNPLTHVMAVKYRVSHKFRHISNCDLKNNNLAQYGFHCKTYQAVGFFFLAQNTLYKYIR